MLLKFIQRVRCKLCTRYELTCTGKTQSVVVHFYFFSTELWCECWRRERVGRAKLCSGLVCPMSMLSRRLLWVCVLLASPCLTLPSAPWCPTPAPAPAPAPLLCVPLNSCGSAAGGICAEHVHAQRLLAERAAVRGPRNLLRVRALETP